MVEVCIGRVSAVAGRRRATTYPGGLDGRAQASTRRELKHGVCNDPKRNGLGFLEQLCRGNVRHAAIQHSRELKLRVGRQRRSVLGRHVHPKLLDLILCETFN